MNIEEYIKLPLNDRADVLWKNAVFVDDRVIYNKFTIAIYHLFNFYVEVYYSVKDNSIKDVKAIHQEEDWDGYLNSINLDYLMRS